MGCWRSQKACSCRRGVAPPVSVAPWETVVAEPASPMTLARRFIEFFSPDKDLSMKSRCPSMRKENPVDFRPIHALSRYVMIPQWLQFSIVNVIQAYCRNFGKYRKGGRRNTHQCELPHGRGKTTGTFWPISLWSVFQKY